MAEAKVTENWQYNKTVLERNKYMLEKQLATDVTFLVGENPGKNRLDHIVSPYTKYTNIVLHGFCHIITRISTKKTHITPSLRRWYGSFLRADTGDDMAKNM